MNNKRAKRIRKATRLQCVVSGIRMDTDYNVKVINKVANIGKEVVPYTVTLSAMRPCFRLMYKMSKDKFKNPNSTMVNRYKFRTNSSTVS